MGAGREGVAVVTWPVKGTQLLMAMFQSCLYVGNGGWMCVACTRISASLSSVACAARLVEIFQPMWHTVHEIPGVQENASEGSG